MIAFQEVLLSPSVFRTYHTGFRSPPSRPEQCETASACTSYTGPPQTYLYPLPSSSILITAAVLQASLTAFTQQVQPATAQPGDGLCYVDPPPAAACAGHLLPAVPSNMW